MNPSLEPEILAALEQAGIEPRSFVRISSLRPADTGRCTYRIDHDRGTVKARRLEDEATARDLAAFRSELPDAFPPVIFRQGRVLIEPWIDGEALPDVPEPHHLATAGALLGELHATSRLGDRMLHEVRSTADHRLLAQKRLRIVVAAGALGEEEAARLERALERRDPLRATFGLVHLDFCGENMVIDRTGRLRVVDNDRVRLDALGYDLARTWYRWALPAPEWEAFCLAYSSRLPFPSSLDTLHFWKITAAAQSAELRLHAYPEKAFVPVKFLRALAAEETV
ncbi:MAG: aminoglycoside phosphotransferase family protein [Terriglobia bacterium]|jgi:Ser/Thr protein kinase RdoA (MazF antagonist)